MRSTGTALVTTLMLLLLPLSGCLQDDSPIDEVEEEVLPAGIFVTGADGSPVDEPPLPLVFNFSDVGEDGAEPSIGVTSSGCIFFIAFEKVMRSCDHGASWEDVTGPLCAFQTNDPYGWVDPVTDRIFNVQMQGLQTSWICWSDDDGETWIGNPHDSGTTPLNDHIKLASGPWTSSGYGIGGQFSQTFYDQAVYYCYNKLAGIFVTGADGSPVDEPPLPLVFKFSDVGEDGAEPSIGVTSSGCIFFIAFEKVMRSCDHGASWEDVTGPLCAFQTNDPYGWVDPVTDRIFNVQMQGLQTSWICWSDDDGETWIGNPHDSGTTPLNDHIKLASGPWTSSGYGIGGQFS